MESISLYICYLDFTIEFVIPHDGEKWEEEVYEIFHKYMKGYLCEFRRGTKGVDAKIEFRSTIGMQSAKSLSLMYIVPTYKGRLRVKEFGQLLREIFITIMLSLAQKKGICLHSSSVSYMAKAILFIGPSGIGKSSICRMLSDKFVQLTDDATFLVKSKRWVTSPLPIFEKNIPLYQRTSAIKYEAKAFYFLKQSDKNRCIKINNRSHIFRLLLDSAIYTGSSYELSSIKLLLSSRLPFYELNFTKEGSISDILETHLE